MTMRHGPELIEHILDYIVLDIAKTFLLGL